MPLPPPPRNERGEVIPHDHAQIAADDGVIRRISQHQIVFDPKLGSQRVSSLAFKPSTGGGMSVDLQRQIEEAGHDARVFVTSPRWMGSVRFTAGQLRDEGFSVGFDPIPPDNPFHGEVWGAFTRQQQGKLRVLCEWFVELEGVSLR